MQEVRAILQKGVIVQGRYSVEDVLGKGGFGAVYLVRDLVVLGNMFALKEVIDPSKEERDRFAFECEVLKRLDHHTLPRVYRVFEDEKNMRAYVLMDYVAGPNLEVLRRQQPEKRFSLSEALHIMGPIFDAVSYLHSRKPPILHRDIKPANIIVPSSGENAVLVDFGIAKQYDQDETTTAVRRCSPGYGAPEQYARGTNPRTDVYGLAATFYALLAGSVPTDALSRMTQLGSKGADPLEAIKHLTAHVPLFVAEAIERAMAINSNERFATAQEFWQALNAHPIQASFSASSTPLPETAPPVAHTPTNNVTAASIVTVHRRPEASLTRKQSIFPILLTLLALTGLAIGVIFRTGMLSTSSPIRSTTITTHLATPTLIPTVRPSPQPTPTFQYPALAAQYTGPIHNDPAQVDSTMSLTHVQQNGANFKGYLTVGTGLQGNGNFTGSISQDKKIRFLVEPFANHLPLLFQGQINADGSLSGTYCSARANQCDNNSGGYGMWRVLVKSA